MYNKWRSRIELQAYFHHLKIYQNTKFRGPTLTDATHPPQQFKGPPFWKGCSYGFKNYGFEITFNGMTSLLNFIQILYKSEVYRVGQTHRQDGDIIHHHHHRFDRPTWALVFLRSFCQLKYQAIASSDFVTRMFSRVGLSALRPSPGYSGGPIFSVRVVSLS
jgi:hypothetical protein